MKCTSKTVMESFKLFARNQVWGTCACCPTNKESVFPEFCVNYHRYDHQLDIDALVSNYKMSIHKE